MKKLISLIFFYILFWSASAQDSFKIHFSNPMHEIASDIIEIQDGSILSVGFCAFSFFATVAEMKGKIWKANPFGDTLTKVFSFGDTATVFRYIDENEYGNLLVFGYQYQPPDYTFSKILILEMNQNLEIIYQKTVGLAECIETRIDLVKKVESGYYLLGGVTKEDGFRRNYILKLDEKLDTICSMVFDMPVSPSCHFSDCIFLSTRLLTFVYSAPTIAGSLVDMYVYDTNLNFLYYKNLPYKLNYQTGGIDVMYNSNLNAKWITDSSFIVGCNHSQYFGQGLSERDIGLSELDTTLALKPVYYFGGIDTIDYAPEFGQTIDFTEPDSILFAGTKNRIMGFLPQQTSFILAGMVDRNLQPRFIRYYGGDAYYITTAMKQAQNGGFIITAIRYDYLVQDQEYDVVLLKLNSSGLITGTSEPLLIPQHGFTIYPNPVGDRLTINLMARKGELTIYDMKGTACQQNNVVVGENNIDIKLLAPGIYICEVVTFENLKLIQRFQKF